MEIINLSYVRKNINYIIVTILLMVVTAIVVFLFKKPEITGSYPPIQVLKNTKSIICDEQITSGLGARDTCEEKNMYGFTRANQNEKLQESLRIGDTDKWISKEAFDKRRIKYRTEDGIIYIKDERLIKELEDKEIEKQFKITNENEKYIIAQLFDDKNTLSTSSATLFLDKSKGLLMLNNVSTSLYCNESLNSYSILYSCRQN